MYYIVKEFSPNIQSNERVVYVLHCEGMHSYHSDQ